jgi:hypothetical protein
MGRYAINFRRTCGAVVALMALAADPAAASPLTASAPAGFTVLPATPSNDGVSILEVNRVGNDDAGCEVAFRAVKPGASRTQAEINANAAKPDFLANLEKQEGGKFEKADVGPFTAGDVQGGALIGVPAGSNGSLRALLVILDMPEGRALVSCSAGASEFASLLPAFEAVARSVKPPRPT